GSFTNTSNKAGYTNFTVLTATLAPGVHNLTLTPGYSGPARNEYWRIWIDYNVDGDFTDAGELAYDAGSALSGVRTGTLTIPSSAAGVTTRMRVAMKRDAAPSPCETFARGEVEDYTLAVPSALLSNDNNALKYSGALQLYPNPVANVLTIVNASEQVLTTLVVYDLNGKEMLRYNEPVAPRHNYELSVTQLPASVYLLRGITASGESYTQRFTKF
ncbi:MAG: GEVED domain-containing protein, partial [Saprospiraceae bacterium]